MSIEIVTTASPTGPSGSLWHITSGQRVRYVAMAASNLFMFAGPLIGKYAIDAVVEQDLGHGIVPLAALAASSDAPTNMYLWLSALLAVTATAAGGGFHYLRGRWAAQASERIVQRLRDVLYRHLEHLPARFHDAADTGDLVQRCSSDVETLRVFLSSDIVEIGRAVILVLTVLPILVWLDPALALVSVALLPPITAFAYVFFANVKTVFQQTDESEAAMTAVLQENLTGIRVVRAFARQDYEIAKFADKNRIFRDNNNRLIRLMGWYWATSDFFAVAQIGAVLIVGGWWVATGHLTVGTLFAFMTYTSMIIWPVRQLGRVLTDSGKAVVALGRVNEILAEPEEAPALHTPDGHAMGQISIRGLTFGYEGSQGHDGTAVLTNVDLDIAAGETIALVGPPGSGKSTLIRLLLRLYEYTDGSIRLDGRELRELDRKWVRQQFGIVMQEPFLYSRSIRDNLLVGRAQADTEAIARAVRDAAIDGAIDEFPEGFDALVGERGVTLSGGQRQRLALARALLKDPPILVLDDALSAIDTGTEKRILAALTRRRGRHTTLVVAHRLSSVMHADRIIVLDGGRIRQVGSHEQLATEDGPYRELCRIQGSLDDQIAGDIADSAAG